MSRGRYCLFVCHDCYKYLTHLLADTRQQSGLFNPNIPTSSAQVEKSGEELIPPASSENLGLKKNKNAVKNTFKQSYCAASDQVINFYN